MSDMPRNEQMERWDEIKREPAVAKATVTSIDYASGHVVIRLADVRDAMRFSVGWNGVLVGTLTPQDRSRLESLYEISRSEM